MPPATTTPHLPKPKPRFFDPWNSSSTGHQRADNRLAGSTSWRESRSLKLGEQFGGGSGGGRRVADTVGAGSKDFGKDGRLENGGWEKGAKGLRGKGQLSLVESFGVRKGVLKGGGKQENVVRVEEIVLEGDEVPCSAQVPREEVEVEEPKYKPVNNQEQNRGTEREVLQASSTSTTTPPPPPPPPPQHPQIFTGLCIYINGSTCPTISDHKLKTLLVTHGARLSISLGRRTVTHVILGRPNGSSKPGAGGGLASSKIQKEISKIGGKSVKYVTVEWVIESIKAGKRVQESKFEAVRLAQKGTGRVGDMFAKAAMKG